MAGWEWTSLISEYYPVLIRKERADSITPQAHIRLVTTVADELMDMINEW